MQGFLEIPNKNDIVSATSVEVGHVFHGGRTGHSTFKSLILCSDSDSCNGPAELSWQPTLEMSNISFGTKWRCVCTNALKKSLTQWKIPQEAMNNFWKSFTVLWWLKKNTSSHQRRVTGATLSWVHQYVPTPQQISGLSPYRKCATDIVPKWSKQWRRRDYSSE